MKNLILLLSFFAALFCINLYATVESFTTLLVAIYSVELLIALLIINRKNLVINY